MIDFCYKTRYDDDRDVDLLALAHRDREQANASVNYFTQALAGGGTTLPPFSPLDAEFSRCPLVTNAKVYILGDKYDIPALKVVAARMYQAVAGDQRYRRTFTESLKLVYENTPAKKDKLRDVVVEAARENLAGLMARRDFRDLLQQNPEIALDILRAASSSTEGGTGKCVTCAVPDSLCDLCRTLRQFLPGYPPRIIFRIISSAYLSPEQKRLSMTVTMESHHASQMDIQVS